MPRQIKQARKGLGEIPVEKKWGETSLTQARRKEKRGGWVEASETDTQSKESASRRSGSPQAKVSLQRSPLSPRMRLRIRTMLGLLTDWRVEFS